MKDKINFTKFLKFLASLKLAVIVIAGICIVIAVGTLVESRYDAEAATKLVYQTFWMYSVLSLLAVNLTAVMVDRWPWKKKHIPFLLAHIGILILLLGSWLTQKFGLDGTMRVEVNKSSSVVTTNQTDLLLYSSKDGQTFDKTYQKEVDFFIDPPTEKEPIVVPTGGENIFVLDYKPYIIPQKKINPVNDFTAGAAVRYQLYNSRVNQIDWINQSSPIESISQNLGPAQVVLAPDPMEAENMNMIFLLPNGPDLNYLILHRTSKKPFAQGTIKEGEELALGWMDLKLKILRYFPQSESVWEITEKERPTPLTTAAIKIRFEGRERWLLLNDLIRLQRTGAALRFVYAQRRLPLKHTINLKKFEVEHYQGTNRAAAYKSLVEVPNYGEHLISMNEPMRMNGLLFYQSSFEDGPEGPTASIFAVNYDPGRWLKYLGSLIMSLGIVLLFYFKKYYIKASPASASHPEK